MFVFVACVREGGKNVAVPTRALSIPFPISILDLPWYWEPFIRHCSKPTAMFFVARKPSTLELEEKSLSPPCRRPVPSPSLDRTFLSALRFQHRRFPKEKDDFRKEGESDSLCVPIRTCCQPMACCVRQ